MSDVKSLQELETDGWIFKVGDVFSNPYEASHFKVTKIELEDGANPDDARICGHRVHPQNHNKRVIDPDVYEDVDNECHRAWYFNDMWSPDSDK